MHKIAIFCGGVSQERGISLNSARSLLDHLVPFAVDLSIVYLNPNKRFYSLTPGQLYSNTPSDFDYQLAHEKQPLEERDLLALLRPLDLVFPLIHGTFGEDGELQSWLETHQIPFVGSSSQACKTAFNKRRAKQLFKQNGFASLPFLSILSSQDERIPDFWYTHCKLNKAILKPAESGSSIGVVAVDSIEATRLAIETLQQRGFSQLLLEPYCEASEFTVCVLQSHCGEPTALIPIEIDIGKTDSVIFDYRKKYLPSNQTRYYCPPRYSERAIHRIRQEAEKLFACAHLADFARIDGWLSPQAEVLFSDINPISGMEQNSFLFQQSARIGMSHADLIEYVINNALKRSNKSPLIRNTQAGKEKKRVHVLMGGATSERQVSLLSGSNVWMKLLHSDRFDPHLFLWDQQGDIWQVPPSFALHHTVEEMQEHCQAGAQVVAKAKPIAAEVRHKLALPPSTSYELPQKINFAGWTELTQQAHAFAFLALHGGAGEDGTIQNILQQKKIPFNGSTAQGARLCMDKKQTAQAIAAMQSPSILPMRHVSIEEKQFFAAKEALLTLWQSILSDLKTQIVVIKPRCDGCSTGVVKLQEFSEFATYIELYRKKAIQIPPNTFKEQPLPIEMPLSSGTSFLVESFIATDKIAIQGTQLKLTPISGWIELTLGVLEQNGIYTALNPSVSVAENAILSVEEKFQGGTGINLTPPPESILSKQALERVKTSACRVAETLCIKGYGRIDLFVERKTGVIQIIEANTLPALTPSTVLYHQALSQHPPIAPRALIETIIKAAQTIGENVSSALDLPIKEDNLQKPTLPLPRKK